MRHIKRKNGFILLLVVAMIPLVGMVLAIIGANSQSLMTQTRMEELRMQAENACYSGMAWVRLNPAKINSLTSQNPITLTIENTAKRSHCLIERLPQSSGQDTLQITGHVEDNRFSANERKQMLLPE